MGICDFVAEFIEEVEILCILANWKFLCKMEVFLAILVIAVVFFLLSKNQSPGRAGGSGGGEGKKISEPAKKSSAFQKFADKYESLPEITRALRRAGVESSQLVVAVDCTKSNTWQGEISYGGFSLHMTGETTENPYEEAIRIIGRTLAPLDQDGRIPLLGFGDDRTTDKSVFYFSASEASPPVGFEQALLLYRAVIPTVNLAGPTSFAPAIRETIRYVKMHREYTILIIIADGQVTNRKATEQAIVEASEYPISIIVVGVGDGPWDEMERFDDELPERKFDNLQFVDLEKVLRRSGTYTSREAADAAFALAALQEIPEQYKAIRDLGLL